MPLDSRRGSHDDVGARDDALPDDVASGRQLGRGGADDHMQLIVTWFGTLSYGRGLYCHSSNEDAPRRRGPAGREWYPSRRRPCALTLKKT